MLRYGGRLDEVGTPITIADRWNPTFAVEVLRLTTDGDVYC
jgi:hypothetical protein